LLAHEPGWVCASIRIDHSSTAIAAPREFAASAATSVAPGHRRTASAGSATDHGCMRWKHGRTTRGDDQVRWQLPAQHVARVV